MVIEIVGAGILAFLAVKFFGRKFIPWLEKHDFTQSVKDEVDRKVYTGEEKPEDGN